MSVVLLGSHDERRPVRSDPPKTEHFYVAVTISGGYDGPTLSPRAIERALIVRALEEEVPLDGIRVQRESRWRNGDDRPVRDDRPLGRAKLALVKEASDGDD